MTCQKASGDALIGHESFGEQHPRQLSHVLRSSLLLLPCLVLVLLWDLSGTNPATPPPRQSQFGFKGNHGRNRACRERLGTLEARRLAADSGVRTRARLCAGVSGCA